MKPRSYLSIDEIQIAAGREKEVQLPAWQLVRLVSGSAYWIGPGQSRALDEGETVVIAPDTTGSLRASLLSDARFHMVAFDPNRLWGVLSARERQFFQDQSRHALAMEFLPPDHPVAEPFTRLAQRLGRHPGLRDRAEVFALIAAVFDERLQLYVPPQTQVPSAQVRFRELVERVPEAELLQSNLTDLAARCGCTARHFSRLFREDFGQAFRDRQTEFRLATASQLLAETQTKIIDVAFESGYRSLGLFNALFKRRYSMTPSAWRRRGAGKKRSGATALLVLVFGALMLGAVQAAETNGVEQTPPGQTNAPVTFEVKGYALSGNTLLPATVTDPLLAKHTGPAVTFETIRQALADLQLAYRDRGYISVAVALPPQQLTNGIVQVAVTEGRLTEIVVHGNRYFSSNNVRRVLPSLHTNMILNSLVFQQELDRANASRDRQIYPVITPGPDPGTSALELKVKDRLPLHGRVELDNYSTPQTPELRANVAVQYNNLWQREHQLGVQYSFSPEDTKNGDYPFYDRPLIANYSAFYRMPLGAINGAPPARDYQSSDFGYDEVTHRFRAPPVTDNSELLFYASRSSSDTGQILQSETLTPPVVPPEGGLQVKDQIYNQSLTVNENIGARWSIPLPDIFSVRSSFSVGPDWKNFRSQSAQNRSFQATVFVPEVGETGPPFSEFPSPPTSSSRSLSSSLQYLPLTLQWEGGERDKWGSTSFTLNQSANYGDLLASKRDWQGLAASTKANGNYYVVTASLTRDQNIVADWGIRLHADGQWANQPLISNEQFALGGIAGVRGYRDGEEYGDTGWRVQFEPHTPVYTVGVVNGVPVSARLFVFADYGQRFLLDPGPRPATVSELGSGGGLDTSIGSHVDVRIAIGVPALDTPHRNSGEARASFSVSAQF